VRSARSIVAVSLSWLWSATALAQSAAPLTQGDDALAFPSVARVLLAFLFTAGIAVAGAYAIRRWMPGFRPGLLRGQPQRLQVVERIQLSAVTRLHLVDIDENKVLIAESRNGVSLTVLPARKTNENMTGKE